MIDKHFMEEFRNSARMIDVINHQPWLVKGMIKEGTINELYGPSHIGKSTLALDIALSLANDQPVLGVIPVMACPVLYYATEGYAGYGKMEQAWLRHRGLLESKNIVYGRPTLQLCHPNAIDIVSGHIDSIVEVYGFKPQFIVIDTLSSNYGIGYDENSTKDMSSAVSTVHRIAERFGTVLVVHHSGKDSGKGSRGSSDLLCKVDSAMEMKPNALENKGSILNCKKLRNSEPFTDLNLKIKKVQYGVEPDDNAAIIIRSADDALPAVAGRQKIAKADWSRLKDIYAVKGEARFMKRELEKRHRNQLDMLVKRRYLIQSGKQQATKYQIAGDIATMILHELANGIILGT